MIDDTGSNIIAQNTNRKNEIRNTISAARASGRGEKSARCGFSSPPRVPYAPTMPRNYALCTMLQLCHAIMHGAPCFNYTGPLTMQLALQAGTFHNMHCTLCSHYAMQLCTAPCVDFSITLQKKNCSDIRHTL